MILQKNKFILSLNEFTLQGEEVYPVYKELKKEDTKDSQNMFFRTTINGEVTFKGSDYEYIIAKSPSTIFYLNIIDRKTNKPLVKGSFRYVDMDVDKNKKSIRVGLTVKDGYKKILTNLETEYDLIKLKPELVNGEYEVSNCLQMTTALSQITTNVYRKNIVNKSSTLTDLDDLARNEFSPWYAVSTLWANELTSQGFRVIGKSTLYGHLVPPSTRDYDQVITYTEPNPSSSQTPDSFNVYKKFYLYSKFTVERNGKTQEYRFRMDWNYIPRHQITTYTISLLALQPSGDIQYVLAGDPLGYDWHGENCNVTSLVSGELTNGEVLSIYHPDGNINMGPGTFYFNYIYARLLSRNHLEGSRLIDSETDSDIYSEYYDWVRAYPVTGGFKFSLRFSETPTEYGIAYREGQGDNAKVYYYDTPDNRSEYIPFIRDEWEGGWSIWVDKSYVFNMFQSETTIARNSNFCEVGSAIKVLLREIDPSIDFDTTKQFSNFLYGTSGVRLQSDAARGTQMNTRILITQKSNTTKPNPDYFAMKAPITLGSLLEMLRNAFDIYWFIDEFNHFRLEHIQWFENNGSYNASSPKVNLAEYQDKFNGKTFAFNTNKFSYDLTSEYTKFKLSWQEESSEAFTECDVTMLNTYDDSNKNQESSINNFTPDIEYQAVFGKDLSKDGFTVVMAVERSKYDYLIPFVDGAINGDMTMLKLFTKLLSYNLPTFEYKFGKSLQIKARSFAFVKKNTIEIPDSIPILSLYTNLLTEVGSGRITKVSRDIDTDYVTIELEYSR